MFVLQPGRRRSRYRYRRRTSSDTGASSAIWNGGVFASFRIRISRASSSTSPVASFGLTVSSDRRCTTPLTPTTNSGRSRFAVAMSASFSRTTTCDTPRAVADIDKGDATEIANAVHPAEQHGIGTNVVRAKRTASMGASQIP